MPAPPPLAHLLCRAFAGPNLPHHFESLLLFLQSLVDMEDLFGLLKTQSRLPEGTRDLLPPPAAPPAPAAAPSSSSSSSRASSSESEGEGRAEGQAGHDLPGASDGNGGSGAAGGNGASVRRRLARARRQAGSSSRGLRVELRGVSFGYSGGRQVLRGVDLTAEPGESVAVVGELLWAVVGEPAGPPYDHLGHPPPLRAC